MDRHSSGSSTSVQGKFINRLIKKSTEDKRKTFSKKSILEFLSVHKKKLLANGISDDIYVREKPPKLGKSACRKSHSLFLYRS